MGARPFVRSSVRASHTPARVGRRRVADVDDGRSRTVARFGHERPERRVPVEVIDRG